MAWRLLNDADSNPNNTLVMVDDWGACCADPTGLKSCLVSAHNLTTAPIDTIVINGVSYPFAESNTVAELEAGINAAFGSAGFIDVDDPDAPYVYGTLVSGNASAAHIQVFTAASALTKLITSGDTDVNFVCTAL